MLRKSAQEYKTHRPRAKQAFTLVELLAVIGTVCLLACFMLPALARAKIKSPSAGCLSNLRQMQLGATMYRDDYNDTLLPNAPAGSSTGWCLKAEDWHASDANTNVADYSGGVLWPYVNQDISVYRCPADFKPSDNGYRLRSYSMNSQMGTTVNYSPGWRSYQKGTDLTCPTPANAFIFCDESMYSLNDGYLQLDLNAIDYPDVPAAYHAGGCGFSFADGHAEIHRWQSPFLVAVPYAYGVVNNGMHAPSSVQDLDYFWIFQRAACHD